MKTTLRHLYSRPATQYVLMRLSAVLLILAPSCSPKQVEQLTILGSNTFGEELAPKLIAEYKKDHPEVAFATEFKGTSYGLGALMVDKCDIAAASREATTNEMGLAKDREIDLNNYVIGSYSVAVIVNANSPLKDLTKDQVRDIFSGKIQNWKDVGGPDAAVHLYIRDPISGTYLGFQELAMEKKDYAQHPKALMSYAAIVQAVAADPAGIGYADIEDLKKPGIKGVSIGGVAPSVATVQKGTYPYARVLRLYTNKVKEKPATQGFIQFITSEKGQKILDDMGVVPHA